MLLIFLIEEKAGKIQPGTRTERLSIQKATPDICVAVCNIQRPLSEFISFDPHNSVNPGFLPTISS